MQWPTQVGSIQRGQLVVSTQDSQRITPNPGKGILAAPEVPSPGSGLLQSKVAEPHEG